jgi:four helix bundle protein
MDELFKGNVVLEKGFAFALEMISFCEELEENKRSFLAKHLSESGTLIGIHINAALHTENFDDFTKEIKAAEKEALATKYWLLLCAYAGNYKNNQLMLKKLEDLINDVSIFNKNYKKVAEKHPIT